LQGQTGSNTKDELDNEKDDNSWLGYQRTGAGYLYRRVHNILSTNVLTTHVLQGRLYNTGEAMHFAAML